MIGGDTGMTIISRFFQCYCAGHVKGSVSGGKFKLIATDYKFDMPVDRDRGFGIRKRGDPPQRGRKLVTGKCESHSRDRLVQRPTDQARIASGGTGHDPETGDALLVDDLMVELVVSRPT